MRKRFLAGFLAVLMLLSVIPVTDVHAETTDPNNIELYELDGYDYISYGKTVEVSSSFDQYGWLASKLVDKSLDESTGWSTALKGNQNDEATVVIDLGEGSEYEIKQVGIFPVTGESLGDYFPVDYKVQISNDKENWTDIYTKEEQEKPTAPVIVTLDEAQAGRYVRLLVTERRVGYLARDGYNVQLAELGVWGKLKTADYTAVDAAIAEANAIDRTIYTSESLAALDAAVAAVERDKLSADQETVNGYAEAIKAAIKGLEEATADYTAVYAAIAEATADYTAVYAAIAEANAIDRTIYTSESLAALDNAVAEAEADKDNTDQSVVDGYATAIEKAIETLVKKTAQMTLVETESKKIADYAIDGYGIISIGRNVTSSSHINNGNWQASNLVDSWLGSEQKKYGKAVSFGWSTAVGEANSSSVPAWATIDLGSVQDIKQVGVFPRDDSNYGDNFPNSYEIRISSDNINWTTVYKVEKGGIPTGPVVVGSSNNPVAARYVQIYVTDRCNTPSGKDGYLVQLSEMVVWGKDPVLESKKPEGYENVSIGKNVTTSSSYDLYPKEGWNASFLVDGAIGRDTANGWTTLPNDKAAQTAEAYAIVDLGKEYELKQVDIFPRSEGENYGKHFPKDFVIQVSSDGNTWTDASVKVEDATAPQSAPMTITLNEAAKGQYVKLLVTERNDSAEGGGHLVQLSEMVVWGKAAGTSSDPVKDKYNIADWAPEGFEHIAKEKNVTASSSYSTQPQEGWHEEFLVDGIVSNTGLPNGWTTNPYDKCQDPTETAQIVIDLENEAEIKSIGLFPRADSGKYGEAFPVDYKLQVSADGNTWTDIKSVTDQTKPVNPVVFNFEDTEGRYVRLLVTERGNQTVGKDGYLVQLSELAVWGKFKPTINLNKQSLALKEGDTEEIKATVIKDSAGEATLTWASSNESVATVDQNGKITAVGSGTAEITVTCTALNVTKTINVKVGEGKIDYDENILISIFWPPTLEYMGDDDTKWDEQYKLMADADIDFINNVTGNDLNAKSTNLKMLEYASKYGMYVSVADNRFGAKLNNLSEEEIKDLIAEYRNLEGLGGYYILDEPRNPNIYLDTYVSMKKADPDLYMHLNFLPYTSYGLEIYKDQMKDWLRLSEAAGYPQDYLMYDLYPYMMNSTNMNGLFTNLQAVYEVGKESGVRTATYLQSVGYQNTRRATDVEEIRYEAMLALAYGYKQVSYFTWFLPTNRSETFYGSVISDKGEPNEIYDGVCQLNKDIHGLGKVLVDLQAEEVYLNGTVWGEGTESIPADFFAQPTDNTNYTVSFLRNPDTGANYLMVVNNDFDNSAAVSLKLDSKITSLSVVSKTDGSLSSYSGFSNGILNADLNAGDGMLFALPAGVDFYDDDIEEQVAGQNLVQDAYILANTSTGTNNEYISNLNDGERVKTANSNGWKSADGTKAVITIDLQTERRFNRLDIYPQVEAFLGESNLPKNFDILVSNDGSNYNNVISVSDFGATGVADYVSFDEQTARYIKLEIKDAQSDALSIGELEVYLDDGTVAKPGEEVVDYTEGENLALNKPVYVSSYPTSSNYVRWGWSPAFANDGKTTNGWTSNIKEHMTDGNAEEWIIIDLGDNFSLDEVKLYAKGSFAKDYTVEISENGTEWKKIADVQDGTNEEGWRKFITVEDAAGAKPSGRYLRVKASELYLASQDDGYLMQIGEIEAYGTPVTDKTEAKKVLDEAKELKDGALVDTTALEEAMDALSDAIDSNATTQSKLDNLVSKVKTEMAAVKEEQNKHNFKTDLQYDDNQHWTGCTHCDEKFSAEGHTFGEWTQTKAPTLFAKGSKERICSECGYTQTGDIGILENTNKGDSSSKDEKDDEPVEVHYADNKTTATTAANAKTGDSAMITELCVAMLICVAGIVFVYVKRRKKDIS